MKRLLLPSALLALTLTACTDAPTAPKMAPQFRAARANPPQSHMWDMTGTWFMSCGTGEIVDMQGKLHQLYRQTGNQFEFTINYAGVTGVGRTTGNIYVVAVDQRGSTAQIPIPSDWAPNYPSFLVSQEIDHNEHVISKGSADNFFLRVHQTYSYTVYFLGTYDGSGNPQYGVKDFVSTENKYTAGCTG